MQMYNCSLFYLEFILPMISHSWSCLHITYFWHYHFNFFHLQDLRNLLFKLPFLLPVSSFDPSVISSSPFKSLHFASLLRRSDNDETFSVHQSCPEMWSKRSPSCFETFVITTMIRSSSVLNRLKDPTFFHATFASAVVKSFRSPCARRDTKQPRNDECTLFSLCQPAGVKKAVYSVKKTIQWSWLMASIYLAGRCWRAAAGIIRETCKDPWSGSHCQKHSFLRRDRYDINQAEIITLSETHNTSSALVHRYSTFFDTKKAVVSCAGPSTSSTEWRYTRRT